MTNSPMPNNEQSYLDRMLEDLKNAERTLLADISNKSNPFREDGEQRVRDSQTNIDRLHDLIRTFLNKGYTHAKAK